MSNFKSLSLLRIQTYLLLGCLVKSTGSAKCSAEPLPVLVLLTNQNCIPRDKDLKLGTINISYLLKLLFCFVFTTFKLEINNYATSATYPLFSLFPFWVFLSSPVLATSSFILSTQHIPQASTQHMWVIPDVSRIIHAQYAGLITTSSRNCVG